MHFSHLALVLRFYRCPWTHCNAKHPYTKRVRDHFAQGSLYRSPIPLYPLFRRTLQSLFWSPLQRFTFATLLSRCISALPSGPPASFPAPSISMFSPLQAPREVLLLPGTFPFNSFGCLCISEFTHGLGVQPAATSPAFLSLLMALEDSSCSYIPYEGLAKSPSVPGLFRRDPAAFCLLFLASVHTSSAVGSLAVLVLVTPAG